MFSHSEYKYVFDNIPQNIIDKSKILIEKHGHIVAARILGYDTDEYANLEVAGRLLIFDLRRKCPLKIVDYIDELKDRFQHKYYQYIKDNAEVLQKEVDKNLINEYKHDFLSANALIKTYLAKASFDSEPVETQQMCYIRIAVQLHFDTSLEMVIQEYNNMSEMWFTHASPTIFNSCFKKNALSSCFLVDVQDDLDDILTSGVHDAGMISAASGAVGISLSKIRHSDIDGGGKSSGLANLIKVINSICKYVDQGGKRPGAICISLRPHHIDIEEFVRIVEKVGDPNALAPDIKTSVYAGDLFFERVRSESAWTLFCPAKTPWLNNIWGKEFTDKYIETEKLAVERENEYNKIKNHYDTSKDGLEYSQLKELKHQLIKANKNRITHKVIKAHELYTLICKTQGKAGFPHIDNCDSINFKCNQKNLGMIQCMNLCQEITLYSDKDSVSSCNLGSVSLRMFARGKIDKNLDILEALNLLGEKTRSLVFNIDKVITHNYYPLDKIVNGELVKGKIHVPNITHRPLGIGASGFAEALYELDLAIDLDQDHVKLLNRMIFASMYWNGICESVKLAILYGAYGSFKGSPLSEGKFQHDLWLDEFKYLGPNKNRLEEPKPIEPSSWGAKSFILPNNDIILPTWDDLRRVVKLYGTRNCLLLALMPTASCSQIARNTETVEIPQSNLFSRKLMNGAYPILNRYLVIDFREIGIWNNDTLNYIQVNNGSVANLDKYIMLNLDKYPDFNIDTLSRVKFLVAKYKTMWEISQKYFLTLSADRGRYICHSQSQNIYLLDPTLKQIKASHLVAYDLGLKNLMYYLRQGASIEPIKFAVDPEISKHINSFNTKMSDINDLVVCDPNNKECLSCQ
jgi:ribonucleoside-diphosphate reductase alpha chain